MDIIRYMIGVIFRRESILGIISIFNDTNITTIHPQYNKMPNSQKAAGRFIQKHLTCILKTKMYYECL